MSGIPSITLTLAIWSFNLPRCLKKSCDTKVKKRMVVCDAHWKDLPAVRKTAIRTVYGRGDEQLKFIEMLVNGDLKTVSKIVADKDVRIETFKEAKVSVDLAATKPEEVKVVYKNVHVG